MLNSTLENWEEKNLIELCNIEIGKTPNRSTLQFWDKNLLTNNTWLSIADLSNSINKEVFKSKEQISDMGASTIKLVKKGTLLLSFKLTIGRVAIAGKDLYTNEAIAQLPIKDKNKIDKYYLYYYLQNFNYDKLLNGDIKVKGKTLNKEKLKTIPIKYPLLLEQQRIVKILDEVFENIEKAKKNAEQNLNNVKELFNRLVNNIFKQNSNTWNKKTLEDLVSNENYSIKRGPFGSSLTKSCFVKSGIRVFEQYNPINNDPYWARYYVTQEKYESLKAFKAGAGDLLISCSGVTLGRIVELPVDVEEGIINQALLKIRLNNSLILNKFFIYLFRSKEFQNKIFEYSQGVAIPNMVGVKELKKIEIAFPSIEKQQKIVKQLDKLEEQTKKLEQIYTQKIKKLEELKQSILQKAFNGEL